MGAISLDDIVVTPLKRIPTDDGDVLHAMKQSDVGYSGFGEVYFSWVLNGTVKAWKCHTKMTLNLVVPVGMVKFVFCLNGFNEFRVEEIGVERYVRLTVPPGVWFGFQGRAEPQNLVMNIANISHDPNEAKRLTLSDIKYDWS